MHPEVNYKKSKIFVSRYIHMACDVLGPRGDERNSCHKDWLAFLAANGIRSYITSFRGNRFNNFFAAAVQLTYHRADVLNFFSLRSPSNLKQKSVAADAACEDLQTMLFALALIYVYFTGPFWVFVRSQMHYLDQYTYIQPMRYHLMELSQYPDMLLDNTSVPHELEAVRVRDVPSETVLAARSDLTEEKKRIFESAMQQMATELLIVTDRQLADFLCGGKYSQEPSPQMRERLSHCLLTNLIGEACFADLDYSMFKSRAASLHFHSGKNMLKRNRTISQWLSRKSLAEQGELLKRARYLGPRMRLASKKTDT